MTSANAPTEPHDAMNLRLPSLLPALLLAACGRGPGGDQLFPLEAGRQWTYRVTTELEDNSLSHETLVMRNEGSEPLHLHDDSQDAWRRRSEDGVTYWLRSDKSGIYRVASKSDLQAEPQPDPAPRFVLRQPLVVGTQWQASTTAYLLQRRQEFPREIRHTHPAVPMSYRIESTDLALDTPVGRFEHCLQVKGQAKLHLFADPVNGWRDLPLTTLEWYCPGIGLARLERHEPAQSAFLSGGSLTMELMAWQ
jgi:hypothetical protein